MSATIIEFKSRVAPSSPTRSTAETDYLILQIIESEMQRRSAATKRPAAAKPSRCRRKGSADTLDPDGRKEVLLASYRAHLAAIEDKRRCITIERAVFVQAIRELEERT
jgi:hypothetical protein